MKSVLVVEDNDSTLAMLLIILNAKGFSVHACKSAEEAQAAMAVKLPDIVLTDYFLSGMDGIALAGWVRSQPGGGRPMIIMLTASEAGRVDSLRPVLAELRVEVVHKPFEPENLYEGMYRLGNEQDRIDSERQGRADG